MLLIAHFRNLILGLLFFGNVLYASGNIEESPDHYFKRVHGHWILEDYPCAVQEAINAFNALPESPKKYEVLITAFAKTGRECDVLAIWDRYRNQFPDHEPSRELIEEIAWGVLVKAASSPSLVMREMALIAAFFSHSTQGVNILYQGMEDPNYAVRALAVKLAGHHRDTKLMEGVVKIFRSNQIWTVRKEAISAIGKMRIRSLKHDLEMIIANPHCPAEEQAYAVRSLLQIMEHLERRELEILTNSQRYGLRLLACQAIAHFLSMRDLDLLLIMTNDSHPDVRAAAFQSIALLHPKNEATSIIELAKRRQNDQNYKVRVSAAWVLILFKSPEGIRGIEKAIFSEESEERLMASAVLKVSGDIGIPLARRVVDWHFDPFVQLNVALGLIGLREDLDFATKTIQNILNKEKNLWGEREWGIFTGIGKQTSSVTEDRETTPEISDRLLRLELLNILAMMETPGIHAVVREYLSERFWGVPATASAMLLLEGDEESIKVVQCLCQDPNLKIRIQAALILSLWSRDESTLKILEEGYPYCSREIKEKIIEGIGRVSLMKSVPFLIEVLREPSQSLRAIAAMALIECVNH